MLQEFQLYVLRPIGLESSWLEEAYAKNVRVICEKIWEQIDRRLGMGELEAIQKKSYAH